MSYLASFLSFTLLSEFPGAGWKRIATWAYRVFDA
jgi:hypothetical protein